MHVVWVQAISNSLWSYSKLAYNPGHRVLDVAARRAAGMLHQYTSQVRTPACILASHDVAIHPACRSR